MNIYARIARFFVTNTQLSLLAVLLVFTFGFLAFYKTPKQYDPEITLPAYEIVTQFPGASAREVEVRITNEVEHALAEIPGVDDVLSESREGGMSAVMVTFAIGTDAVGSRARVDERMQALKEHLPMGATVPVVRRVDPENVPVLTIALTSDAFSPAALRDVGNTVRERLQKIPGVSHSEVFGGKRREMVVTPDGVRMTRRGISMEMLTGSLDTTGIHYVGATDGSERVPLIITEGTQDAQSVGNIRVGGTATSPVLLRDVASVVFGVESTTQRVEYAEKKDGGTVYSPAVYVTVAKTQGENISSVTERVRESLVDIEKTVVPDGVRLQVTRDEGTTAHEEIMMLTEHLSLAVLIVTLVLMYFLGMRIAFVVATAIPLTLLMVFLFGFMFDQSINRITLFALIFSLGLLVDDAIVVIENIHRHMQKQSASLADSIALATGEVGTGVLLSTITAVVVFAPMGIVTGMMGAYMGPIAFFAPVARLASLVVAYTLSPYLASVFLSRRHNQETKTHTHDHEPRYVRWYAGMIARLLQNDALQRTIVWATSAFVVFSFLLPFVGAVHFRMLPKADKQQFYVYIDAPQHVTVDETYAVSREVTDVVVHTEGVRAAELFVGTSPVLDFNGLFKGAYRRTLDSQASIKVTLTHKNDRSYTSEDIVRTVRERMEAVLHAHPSVSVRIMEDPPGPPVLATMVVRVKGEDAHERDAIVADVAARMRSIQGVTDIDTTLTTQSRQSVFRIDREKAERAGVSIAHIQHTIASALSGEHVSYLHEPSHEQVHVVVRLDAHERTQPHDLLALSVRNERGNMVPLRSLVIQENTDAPQSILHDARMPMGMVTAETNGRAVVYTTIDLMKALWSYSMPNVDGARVGWDLFGMDFENAHGDRYRIEWGGEFEMTLENFRDLGAAMVVSYLLIYMILVAQFRSFRTPGLIMTTILLGFAGVLPGFALLNLFGVYFSATAMIGAIALGGIVVGNAILLLDFIETARAAGAGKYEAVIGACTTRLQPIMLTSVTAVLGAIVIVADPVWSGLAWALTFGLSLSTVLTLVIFPVLYMRFAK